MGDWRRHAIYFAPARGSALARFGAAWLGWDPEAGTEPAREPVPPLAERRPVLTAAPRRYGFHATLKPPFALAPGCGLDGLDAAAERLAARHRAFALSRLGVAEVGRFIALVPAAPPSALGALADACVTELDGFRAPAGEVELARRRAAGLDPVEAAHLSRWGYPYVLDRFTFHMTLTGPLDAPERAAVRAALAAALAPVLAAPVAVDGICRFSEAADGRFRLIRRFPLGR